MNLYVKDEISFFLEKLSSSTILTTHPQTLSIFFFCRPMKIVKINKGIKNQQSDLDRMALSGQDGMKEDFLVHHGSIQIILKKLELFTHLPHLQVVNNKVCSFARQSILNISTDCGLFTFGWLSTLSMERAHQQFFSLTSHVFVCLAVLCLSLKNTILVTL